MAEPTGTSPTTCEEPVARLLAIGEPPAGEWPDYPATYGLTEADVPFGRRHLLPHCLRNCHLLQSRSRLPKLDFYPILGPI